MIKFLHSTTVLHTIQWQDRMLPSRSLVDHFRMSLMPSGPIGSLNWWNLSIIKMLVQTYLERKDTLWLQQFPFPDYWLAQCLYTAEIPGWICRCIFSHGIDGCQLMPSKCSIFLYEIKRKFFISNHVNNFRSFKWIWTMNECPISCIRCSVESNTFIRQG